MVPLIRIVLIAAILALTMPAAFALEVEAEGRAAGDLDNAREVALADALREAVRIGTGLDLSATTQTRDFTLSFDSVLTHAFGHVKDYKVLGSSLGSDGIYRVRVRAQVEKGSPKAGHTLAIRHLLMLKGAPRIFFAVEPPEARAFLESEAKTLNLPVVDRMGKSDLVIEGQASVRPLGRETLHGSGPKNVFAPLGSLRAVRPDTGEIVAVQDFPGSARASSSSPEPAEAAREALEAVLRGGEAQMPVILSRTISAWVVETDLGALKRLEFEGIGRGEFDELATSLSLKDKVSAVWPREFDAAGKSTIDVETRLDNASIGSMVSEATGGERQLGRSSGNVLLFVPSAQKKGFFQ